MHGSRAEAEDYGAFANQPVAVAGEHFIADRSGALYWPSQRTLIVADLHLEKGSSFAARGVMLPPYDTRETLTALARVLAHWPAKTVIALGDSLHDLDAAHRIGADDLALIHAMQRERQWIWVTGNHDPDVAVAMGGVCVADHTACGIVLRHAPRPAREIVPPYRLPSPVAPRAHPRDAGEGSRVGGPDGPMDLCITPIPDPSPAALRAQRKNWGEGSRKKERTIRQCQNTSYRGQISGHLHPAARVALQGRTTRRRCFIGDGVTLILPAFGAFTGGLNVRDTAFEGLFDAGSLSVLLIGDDGVYPVSTQLLCPD